MRVKGNIWMEGKNGLKIGKGRAMLLQKINETGSIAEAARSLKLSYRRAWAMVKELNTDHSKPIVDKLVGGINGGGAKLTHEGIRLLSNFNQLQKAFEQFEINHSRNISSD